MRRTMSVRGLLVQKDQLEDDTGRRKLRTCKVEHLSSSVLECKMGKRSKSGKADSEEE
jgi:hypothetical protein